MSFFDIFNDTIQLTKHTFVVIGKNKAIFRPTITQLWLAILFYLFCVISLFLVFYLEGTGKMVAALVFIFFLFLLLPIFPFIKIYYRAAQCWIVYNTFTGKNVTYGDGLARAKQNKGDIFLFGIFDIILTALARQLKQGTRKGGLWIIINIVMYFIGKAIEEGWDLIGHYLLPAAIIQDKNVKEVLPEIKNIKNNVPGALAGVFGFDFIGDIIRGYITGFLFLFLILGILIWFFLQTWIPFAIILFLIIGINIVIKIFLDMIKTVYFTLFYMSITMPMKISTNYRKEVTNYLLYKGANADKRSMQTDSEKINQLIHYIQQYRKQGYNDNEIKSFLVKNGWPENIVSDALKQSK